MKIRDLDAIPVSVPYNHPEVSSRVERGGVTVILVKLTTDNGLVGWGESCVLTDARTAEAAVRAAAPFVVGRDPWDMQAITRDYFNLGLWDFAVQTGNFAFAGVDQALWDLCGKDCNQPVYRLLGGAARSEVEYFYYLRNGDAASLREQCADGVARGYDTFYLKVGVNETQEAAALDQIRREIGPDRRLRVDANQAWTVPEAIRILNRWHEDYNLDFCEAPVPVEPIENMVEIRAKTNVAICANEGLGSEAEVSRVIRHRAADVLCFSSYWVGTLRTFCSLCDGAAIAGLGVVKHTHGELGLAAAAGQHAMLAVKNAVPGSQQTAMLMSDDVLAEEVPIAQSARWGRIEAPGLGVIVDEAKVHEYHQRYVRDGQFMPYSPAMLSLVTAVQ